MQPSRRWPRSAHILLQCLLIFVVVSLFLMVLGDFVLENELIGAIGASSLGATSFIAFVTPSSPTASVRRMGGGYIIAVIIGVLGYHFIELLMTWHFPLTQESIRVLVAGLALAIVMILMIVCKMQHPPAAGLCIALIIEPWNLKVLLIITGAIILIALLRYFFRPWLIDMG